MENNWKYIKLQSQPPIAGMTDSKRTKEIDLSLSNKALEDINLEDLEEFNNIINEMCEGRMGIGGYGEKRNLYRRPGTFDEVNPRNIHLGIDIWCQKGTGIVSPLDGIIHSFEDNARNGDYGPTIIVEHRNYGLPFFTLYGHLDKASIEALSLGQSFEAGQPLARVGGYPENGNWPPHLHFQLIIDIGEHFGDYPGVATETDARKWLNNSPNPLLLFA